MYQLFKESSPFLSNLITRSKQSHWQAEQDWKESAACFKKRRPRLRLQTGHYPHDHGDHPHPVDHHYHVDHHHHVGHHHQVDHHHHINHHHHHIVHHFEKKMFADQRSGVSSLGRRVWERSVDNRGLKPIFRFSKSWNFRCQWNILFSSLQNTTNSPI